MVRCDICTCLTRKWQSWARTLSSIFVTRQCNRLKDLKVENRNEVIVIVIHTMRQCNRLKDLKVEW